VAADWVVEALDRTHNRTAFTSGNAQLDEFLRAFVSQYERRRLGRTFVAVRAGERKVLGYYTLASGAVSFDSLPSRAKKKLPSHPVPVVLLARLAVDREIQGLGVGQFLLVDAMKRCVDIGERLGVHAIEVDAIDEGARRFYEKYGFVSLVDDRRHLFLPLATVQDGFARHR
jgi:GNAT superfamily N-acetyltransferase